MHPVLFRIGDFAIGTYGVMIVIGMLTGLALVGWLGRRRGFPPQYFSDLLLVLVVSGFLGARALYIKTEWDAFLANPMALILSRQGFVFLGGMVTALAAGVWFTWKRGVPILEAADTVAPAVALGHAFGRIGCFLAGCCYGTFCTDGHGAACTLGVRYPVALDAHGQPDLMFNYAWQDQLQRGLIGPGDPYSLPVVPVQLMESVGNFLIAGLLTWFWLRRRRHPGQAFALYLMLYSVLRFGLEYLRGDAARGLYFNGALSTSQLISAVMLVAGAVLIWAVRRRPLPEQLVLAPPTAAGKAPQPRRRAPRQG